MTKYVLRTCDGDFVDCLPDILAARHAAREDELVIYVVEAPDDFEDDWQPEAEILLENYGPPEPDDGL